MSNPKSVGKGRAHPVGRTPVVPNPMGLSGPNVQNPSGTPTAGVGDQDIEGAEPTAVVEHSGEDLHEVVIHAAEGLNRPPIPAVEPRAAMPIPDLQDLPRLVGIAVLGRLAYWGMEATMDASRRLNDLPASDLMTDEDKEEQISRLFAATFTLLAIFYVVEQGVDWLKRRLQPDA